MKTFPDRQATAARCTLLAAVFVLQACGTAPTGKPATGGPASAPSAPTDAPPRPAAVLATERQWLQSWFEGTPVKIAQAGDTAPITVDVPREFCFTAGRSKMKPALTAVLDKVAESLRRSPGLRLPLVAAPADDTGPASLAGQRAAQVRAHLMMRGVRYNQIAPASATTTPAVQLRIELGAP